MILECSSKGDKRFSALYAKVSVNGYVDTIENHYQLSKVFQFNNTLVRPSSFKQAKHWQHLNEYILVGFSINNQFYDKKFLSMWYASLWIKYFKLNPDLLNVISQYDDFHDSFERPNTINSQAKIIKCIAFSGIDYLYSQCTPFFEVMKYYKESNTMNLV